MGKKKLLKRKAKIPNYQPEKGKGSQECTLSSVGILETVTGLFTTSMITTGMIVTGMVITGVIITFTDLRMTGNGFGGGLVEAFASGALPGSEGAIFPLL